MRPAARRRAREGRRREGLVQAAFEGYLDITVARLGEVGVEGPVAMDAVFNTVEYLGGEGILPAFPEGEVSYQAMGRWLIAAVDFGFTDFMVEAAQE